MKFSSSDPRGIVMAWLPTRSRYQPDTPGQKAFFPKIRFMIELAPPPARPIMLK
jgi:hypothetical protein